jgi:hypothetical protein
MKNEDKVEREATGARLAGGVAFEGVTTNLQMRKLTRSESRNSLSTMAPAVQNRGGARQQVAAVSRLVVAGESAAVWSQVRRDGEPSKQRRDDRLVVRGNA